MEKNFPCPIVSEKDLNIYEDYLRKSDGENRRLPERVPDGRCGYEVWIEKGAAKTGETKLPPALCNTVFLPGYLKTQIGKTVRVESLIGGCLERRVGTLIQVGADYIVLKLYQSCSTMICEASSIKYITVIHDNDLNKAGLY